MIKRGIKPHKGSWSLPAGFLERDERPEKAAARELEEETGLKTDEGNLEFVDTIFLEHPNGQHVLGLIYRVGKSDVEGTVVAGSDAVKAEFVEKEEIDKKPISYSDYRRIVQKAFRQ